VLDGQYEAYFQNGGLLIKETYKDGKRDGPYEIFRENGESSSKGIYKDGEKCGEWFELGNTVTYDPC